MPNTPNEVNRLKLGIITGGEEVWSNAQMEPTGEWFVNKGDWFSSNEGYDPRILSGKIVEEQIKS